MALTTWDEQQYFEAYEENLKAQGARNASSLHRILSTGAGEARMANPIKFSVTFLEQPVFTSGVTIQTGNLIQGAYPVANVGVYKWQADTRGFWIGAWLWVAVTFGTLSLDDPTLSGVRKADGRPSMEDALKAQRLQGQGDTQSAEYFQLMSALKRAQALNAIKLSHHLRFEGLAIRDVNISSILDD